MPVITINTAFFEQLLSARNPADVMVQLFYSGGWVIFVYVILIGLWNIWVDGRQIKWMGTVQTVLLAINVPKETEQSPKAVEHVFATLYGSMSSYDRIEKYWIGKIQPFYSFEIASIDGHVQFFCRSWVKFRDLAEAAIYAQYPDAEITEVDDYTKNVPKRFPYPGWDLFGTEFVLMNKDVYPIRTHPAFEHSASGEFKDPMATFLENMAKMRSGEQLWVQIIVMPADPKDWRAQGEKIVSKLIGKKTKEKVTLLGELLKVPGHMIDGALMTADAKPAVKKDDPPTLMLHLSPGERVVVEGIQTKLAKLPFRTKIRTVYVGKKEGFAKGRTIAMMKGTFGQFTIMDQNGFKAYGKVTTKSDYAWQTKKVFEYLSLFMIRTLETRQNTVLAAYRNRSMISGATPNILNIEELATIFHFPVVTVKTPLLKKTESKRGEPPFTLPAATESFVQPPPAKSLVRTSHPLGAPLRPAAAKFVPAPQPVVSEPAPKPSMTAKDAPPEDLPFV